MPKPLATTESAIHPASLERVARSQFFVRRLYLEARVGVDDWERNTPQPVILDMEFMLPTGLSCLTDRLEHTVDHRDIVERLRQLVAERAHDLVEALAENMATLIQTEFGVPWLKLTLTKVAPYPGAEVGVVIERGDSRCR